MTAAVSVEGLSKRYTLGTSGGYERLTEVLSRSRRGSTTEDRDFWALREVTFEVAEGEALGIIGRNGAGKSTLLKILARITEPTGGRAVLRGRVGSLLEVGTGFHPELTGRENIFLNGAVLGMRRHEISQRFDAIVEFAEVGRFLDTPVKRFSSGMYVRLAFAVAAHLEPEILVVDEVLAVGDAAFQKKCLGKMGDVARGGRTVLFVSHNMTAVQSLCSRAVLLDEGRTRFDGDPATAIDRYLAGLPSLDSSLGEQPGRQGDGSIRFIAVELAVDGAVAPALRCGRPGQIRLQYEAAAPGQSVSVSVGLFAETGEGALFMGNDVSGDELLILSSSGTLICSLDRVRLLPGTYVVNLFVSVNGRVADWIQEALRIEVVEDDFFGSGRLPPRGYGFTTTEHQWTVW